MDAEPAYDRRLNSQAVAGNWTLVLWSGVGRAANQRFRSLALLQLVDFDERVTSGVLHAAHDGSVTPRLQRGDDGRFEGIARRKPAGLNLSHLIARYDSKYLGRLPIVIASKRALGIMQFQLRIAEHIGHSK